MKSLTKTRGVVLTGALMLLHASTALAAGTTTTGSGESTPLNLTGVAPGKHTAGGGGSSIVRTVVGLFIVIAVIYGVAWILRQAKRGRTGRALGKALHPIASMPLGSGRSVQMIRAGTDVLVIGVAEHGVTPIRRYTEAEAIEAGLDVTPEDPYDGEDERPVGRVVEALRRMTVRS
jgi:flagellar protein FliO/FliZ